jgi:hypothetical protein
MAVRRFFKIIIKVKMRFGYWFGPPWTGLSMTFDAATTVGFKVARPHAISKGKREKSTMQPSRLKQLKSYDEPIKIQSDGHDSVHIEQNMHFV